jgi:hypothetical protein
MGGGRGTTTDFSYDPAVAETVKAGSTGYNPTLGEATTGNYNTGSQMSGIIGDLSSRGTSMWDKAQEFLDPSSQYYKDQRGYLSEAVADATQQTTNQQNQIFAQRGIGSGGIKNILSNVNANRSGESVRQGMKDLVAQGVGQGTQLAGVANQATSAAGQFTGDEASRGLQMNLANLQATNTMNMANMDATNTASQFGAAASNQASLFNAGAENQANLYNAQAQDAATQYDLTSTYNQNLANAQRNDAWNNQWLNMGMGVALAPFTGGTSLIAGATT